MAYLAAKRKEMAALSEMAAVAQMQADLARQVESRMQKIDQLLTEPGSPTETKSLSPTYSFRPVEASSGGDSEVEFWRRKIADLSAPVPGAVDVSLPSRVGRSSPPGHVAEAKLSWEGTSAFSKKQQLPLSEGGAVSPGLSSAKLRPGSPDAAPPPASFGAAPKTPLSSRGSPPLPSEPRAYTPQDKPSSERPGSRPWSGGGGSSAGGSSGGGSSGGGNSGGGGGGGGDAEVDYWRRKIAELSSADPTAGGGYHSSSLPSGLSPTLARLGLNGGGSGYGSGQPLARLDLRNPRYKARSLADEPLSWEGTASFADENKAPQPPPARPQSAFRAAGGAAAGCGAAPAEAKEAAWPRPSGGGGGGRGEVGASTDDEEFFLLRTSPRVDRQEK